MISDKTRAFHRLNKSDCFVIPNPWDVGSGVLLEQLGFSALATTSSGMSWAFGKSDNNVPLDLALEHFRRLCAAVSVPVCADFEGAFAVKPDGVNRNVTRAIETGLSGLSVEDSTGDAENPLFEFELAVDRIRAARSAIDTSGTGALLTARTEGFIVNRPDFEETVRRLVAFADAGADCLFAPGVTSLLQIRKIVDAVAPKAVCVIALNGLDSVSDLAEIGVRRISVGSGLARTAYSAFMDVASEILSTGSFRSMHSVPPSYAINERFKEST